MKEVGTMEGSAFDAGAPAAEKDPFGENGQGDFTQEKDPFDDDAPAPRVDREGNLLDGGAPMASAEEEAQLAAAQASAEEAGIDTTGVGEAAQQAAEVAQEATAPDPPSAPTAGAETASSAASTEKQSAADLNGAQAPVESGLAESTDPSPAAANGSSEAPGAAAGSEADAEAPKAKKGTRPYRLFVPEGNGKFAEVAWHEDKAGKQVKSGTPGAKKQTVVQAHDQEGALRFGFHIVGAPKEGAKLVAVAVSQWAVRHIEPAEQVVRQRLNIR